MWLRVILKIFLMQVLQYKGGLSFKWTMFFATLTTCKYCFLRIIAQDVHWKITMNDLDKWNILVLIFIVRFWILNYYIFIWIKRIPKVQRKMNHFSLKLQQHFLINCTRHEVQWCPLHRIKLNPKIFLIFIFMDMFLKYFNFCLKNIKGIFKYL
jgi:hypothetical protein